MNLSRCIIPFLAVAVIAAHADETNLTLTVDGVTYSNVTFGTVTPTKATIFHTGGVASFPLGKLPPDLQQRFGYDPQKAAEWQKAQGQESFRRSWTDALAKKLPTRYREIKGKVYDFSAVIEWQKLAGAANSAQISREQVTHYYNRMSDRFGGRSFPSTTPKTAPIDRAEQERAEQERRVFEHAKIYDEGEPKWSGYQVRGDVVSVLPDGVIVRNPGGKVWFLKNHPDQSKLVDDTQVDVLAMPVGQFTYTKTSGAKATVEAYDFGTMPTWREGQQIVPVPSLAK